LLSSAKYILEVSGYEMWKSTLKVLVLLITAAIVQLSSLALVNSSSYYKAPPPQVIYQVDGNHPPFEISSGDGIYGFGMDLGRTIFSVGNFDVQYSSDTWSNVYDRLKNGQVDICGLLVISDKRKKEILFTKPVVRTFRAVYAKKDLKVEKTSDIAKYRIGVQKSDYSESILQNELGIKDYETYNDLEECINSLKEGNIDIMLGNQEVANYLLVKHQLSSEITPHILKVYTLTLCF
jgi:polar amino acid transport system substrate-binding protein